MAHKPKTKKTDKSLVEEALKENQLTIEETKTWLNGENKAPVTDKQETVFSRQINPISNITFVPGSSASTTRVLFAGQTVTGIASAKLTYE